MLAHDLTQHVLAAAQKPSDSGGDEPWWWAAGGTTAVAILGAIIRKALKLDPPPSTDQSEGAPGRPVTTGEKLDAAKELVAELRAQRDETKSELREIAARHARELDDLRRRHDREIGEMQAKLRSQDVYIEGLERRIGLGPAGPTDPFPRQ